MQSLGRKGHQFRFHVVVWCSAPPRYLLLFITEVRLSQIVVLIRPPSRGVWSSRLQDRISEN